MSDLPTLFVSHGAPTLALEGGASRDFLRGLAARLPRPRAILAISAHWETARPTLSLAERPETIHDFYGFPEALYRLSYPAPGAPEIAREAVALLGSAGIAAETAPDRGLDHGAWVPLMLAWPEADVPVTQLSIQPQADPAHHHAVGAALAPLRKAGVLILASGGEVHNLRAFRPGRSDVPGWAAAFDGWLDERLTAGAVEDLLDYRRKAPFAAQAHPTDEHLLPLFVALGAADLAPRVAPLHRGFEDGGLGMAAYRFG